jgi:UDP-glucose 4-epimerase
MHILVTGGTGYIGSHTVVELLQAGHSVSIIDNFANSSPVVLDRIEKITGQRPTLYEGEVQDASLLQRIFQEQSIEAVLHFAGLKAVGESVQRPLQYYRNNLDSSLTLCAVMQEHAIKKLIFSSSATVYGEPETLPLLETSRVGVGIPNPYGRSKYMIEQILADLARSDPDWQITCLRYFNPIGAHVSGLIGEDPRDTPNNLLPYVAQVAVGKLPTVQVYGDDYDTPDGTGVRDYIHVVDVAQGHVAALEHLQAGAAPAIYNLGTGKGSSVLEVIEAFERAAGQSIPYQIRPRRPGDVASCYAHVSKANRELNWQSHKTLAEACVDSWRWQSQNPEGYSAKPIS